MKTEKATYKERLKYAKVIHVTEFQTCPRCGKLSNRFIVTVPPHGVGLPPELLFCYSCAITLRVVQ